MAVKYLIVYQMEIKQLCSDVYDGCGRERCVSCDRKFFISEDAGDNCHVSAHHLCALKAGSVYTFIFTVLSQNTTNRGYIRVKKSV